MFAKPAALICLASLLITGCGGSVTEEPSQSFESTQQEILWECVPNDNWVRRWYSNSSKTNEVGREDCYCGQLSQYGTLSGYYSQTRYGYCAYP